MSLKACNSILSSVYFAPDQIRTCCKRFHVDGEVKGDAVLFNSSDNLSIANVRIADIIDKKHKLISEINSKSFNKDHQCFGCPWLVDYEIPPSPEINLISFEMHSVCNMRCTYCSDTYYGGIQSPYDTDSLLTELDCYLSNTSGNSNVSIVFGGGEPVLFKNFAKVLNFAVKHSTEIIVFTNSTIYSDSIQEGINTEKISIITSIDAGDPQKFQEVRKLNAFDKVLNNLSLYSSQKPAQVTIKYIFTSFNSTLQDIEGFLANIKKYCLFKCNFQISSDFKSSSLTPQQVHSIQVLKHRLQDEFNANVFVDDHLAPRLIASNGYGMSEVKDKYVVWGCGEHCRRIFERIGVEHVKYFVDRSPTSSIFMGLKVLKPDQLPSEFRNEKVFIATVFSYNAVHNELKEMKGGNVIISEPY